LVVDASRHHLQELILRVRQIEHGERIEQPHAPYGAAPPERKWFGAPGAQDAAAAAAAAVMSAAAAAAAQPHGAAPREVLL